MPKYAPDFWRNNYLDMSSASGGDAVWQTMGTTAKPAAEGQATGSSAYETYKGLLSLAKTHAAAAGQVAATKGTCKRCGATGHLTFQCRNHMRTTNTEKGSEASRKAVPERWEMPSSTSSVTSEEEPGQGQDSDAGEHANPRPEGLRGRGGAQFHKDEQYYAPRRPRSPPAPTAATEEADGTEVVFIPEPLKRRGRRSSSSSSSSDDGSSKSSTARRRKNSEKSKKRARRRSASASASSAGSESRSSSSSSSSSTSKRQAKKKRRKEKRKTKKAKEKKKKKRKKH